MPFDFDQFAERQANNRAQNVGRELVPLFRVIDGARPVMDKLVRSDEWRRYLQILQGVKENAEAAKARALASLSAPGVWDHETLARLKSDALCAQAMIDAWTLAIELPASILDGGEKANEILKRLEEKHAATGKAEPQSA